LRGGLGIFFCFVNWHDVSLLGFSQSNSSSLILGLLLHNTHAIVETTTALGEFASAIAGISCTGLVTITVAFARTAKICGHINSLS